MKKGSQLQKFYAKQTVEYLENVITENTEKLQGCIPQLADFYRNQIYLAKNELKRRG